MMNQQPLPHYLISSEHYLRILFEYFPRELDSINRLTSKSFNRVLIDTNNNNNFITGHKLVEYLIANGMITLFHFVKESGCKFYSKDLCNIAARNGQIDCLIHFRSEGYHCNGESTMISAALGGQLQMMIYLHEMIKCKWPIDICYHSASGGNVECLIYGHQHGCKRGDIATCSNAVGREFSSLYAAAGNGHLAMVRELLDRCDKIDTLDLNSIPLLAASRGGHIEVVRELLDRGADINARSDFGMNSLMLACRYGHIEVVRELLDRGADIHSKNNGGCNALAFALQNNDKVVADELLRRAGLRSLPQWLLGKLRQLSKE